MTALDGFEALATLTPEELDEMAVAAHLGIWTERRAGLPMSPLHWEWCNLRMTARRLAVIAPREHAKSETFTVNGTVWESIYNPGLWTYIFANTAEQAEKNLAKILQIMEMTAPWMVSGAHENNKRRVVFANYATIDVAGAGKAVRGAHPDVIIGDDVLVEDKTHTALQRLRTSRWWNGTIGGMPHPGTLRVLGKGDTAKRVWMPPSRVYLVGTPFHKADLLMSMKKNPVYEFRRYAAEFHPGDLVDGLAVEVG